MRKTVRFALIAVVLFGVLAGNDLCRLSRIAARAGVLCRSDFPYLRRRRRRRATSCCGKSRRCTTSCKARDAGEQVFQGRDDQWLAGRRPAAEPPHAAAPGDARSPRTHRPAGHHDGLPGRSRADSTASFRFRSAPLSSRTTSWGCGSTRPGWVRFPGPFATVLDKITDAAQKSNVDIRWRQADSDPVALIKIPSARGDRKQIIHIETIAWKKGHWSSPARRRSHQSRRTHQAPP